MQHVDIMEGPDGRSKGCALVWFDSPEAARKAIGKRHNVSGMALTCCVCSRHVQ